MDNGPSLLFWVLAIPPTHTRISVEVNMEIFTFRCNLRGFLCSSGQRTRQVGEFLVCTLFTCSAQWFFVGVCTMVSLNSWSRKTILPLEKQPSAYPLPPFGVSLEKRVNGTLTKTKRKDLLTYGKLSSFWLPVLLQGSTRGGEKILNKSLEGFRYIDGDGLIYELTLQATLLQLQGYYNVEREPSSTKWEARNLPKWISSFHRLAPFLFFVKGLEKTKTKDGILVKKITSPL